LNLFNEIPEGQMIAFALVLLRCIAFIVAMPIIGQASVPVSLKILFSLTISIMIFPIISFTQADQIKIGEEIILFAMREVTIGLILGFIARMFFFAVQASGELIGVSSGLASAQLYNPMMGTNGNVFEQFHMIIATLFFLALDGHHRIIEALAKSYEIVPVTATSLKVSGYMDIAGYGQDILILAIKLSAPLMVSIFVINIAMGLIGRAVPQINVLVTSMQVTVVITLGVLIVSLPFYVDEMGTVLKLMTDKLFFTMKVM
jgi:flagellar biosynthesis protein FliR